MKILIITSCTGQKATDDAGRLTLADFQRGQEHVRRREASMSALRRLAREMYTGDQHTRLMEGIKAVMATEPVALTVDLWIVSAGYGLIPGHQPIAPYECTFNGMPAGEKRSWAEFLGLRSAFERVVASTYDLGVLLLGEHYLKACRLDPSVKFYAPAVAFCGSTVQAPKVANLRIVPLVEEHTRAFSCGNVGLKGEIAARLLACLAAGTVGPEQVADSTFDLLKPLKAVPR